MLDLHLSVVFLVKGALLGLLGLIVYIVFNPWQRFKLRHIPGPPWRLIYGNLPEFREVGSHEFMRECRQRYGPIFKMWAGHSAWIIVCEPDVGKRVNYKLINRPTRIGDPLMRGAMTQQENKGLFLSRDDHWRKLHRVWQPAFYAESVRACAPLMDATTQRMLDRLDSLAAAGQSLDIWREVGNLTMQIVGSGAYGIDFHTLDAPSDSRPASPAFPALSLRTRLAGAFGAISGDPESFISTNGEGGRQLIESAKVLFRSASASAGSFYQSMAMLSPACMTPVINFMAHAFPDAAFKRVLEARMTLCAASLSLVRQARRAAASQDGSGSPGSPSSPSSSSNNNTADTGFMSRHRGAIAPGSFLGLLLSARDKAGCGLTDLQMLVQSNTFTLAGYETTANTLAFSLFCLATHPEAEAKMVAEIRALAAQETAARAAAAAEGVPHQAWYSKDLDQQLPFTCAVISEALRLYPPGAVTMRETGEEPFDVGGYLLPPRSSVFVGTYVMQRDPELWPKADAFVPERFLPGHEDLAAKNPAAYLPFGSGGRQCIGQRFALLEVRLGLVQLMQRFHFDIDWSLMAGGSGSGSKADNDSSCTPRRSLKTVNYFTLSPADGIWVRLSPRPCAEGSSLL